MHRRTIFRMSGAVAGFAISVVGVAAMISAVQIASRTDPVPLFLVAGVAFVIAGLAGVGMAATRPRPLPARPFAATVSSDEVMLTHWKLTEASGEVVFWDPVGLTPLPTITIRNVTDRPIRVDDVLLAGRLWMPRTYTGERNTVSREVATLVRCHRPEHDEQAGVWHGEIPPGPGDDLKVWDRAESPWRLAGLAEIIEPDGSWTLPGIGIAVKDGAALRQNLTMAESDRCEAVLSIAVITELGRFDVLDAETPARIAVKLPHEMLDHSPRLPDA